MNIDGEIVNKEGNMGFIKTTDEALNYNKQAYVIEIKDVN